MIIKENKKGNAINVREDPKLSESEMEFISYVAELADENWYEVLNYIETHHLKKRLKEYDEELAQEIRGGLLMKSINNE